MNSNDVNDQGRQVGIVLAAAGSSRWDFNYKMIEDRLEAEGLPPLTYDEVTAIIREDAEREAEERMATAETPEEFSRYLMMSGVGSGNRLGLMLVGLDYHEDAPGMFWPILLTEWSGCDNTWQYQEWLLGYLQSLHEGGEQARDYMNDADGEWTYP